MRSNQTAMLCVRAAGGVVREPRRIADANGLRCVRHRDRGNVIYPEGSPLGDLGVSAILRTRQGSNRMTSLPNESVDISVFRDIHIRFPGDVYILAAWLAMSDLAKNTPTRQVHTTLHGLARELAMLQGVASSDSLDAEEVLAVFRDHGISGNLLTITNHQELLTQLKINGS
jgi:hypothetical protein